MNGKLTRLAVERARLQQVSQEQRMRLRQDIEPWRARLVLADRGLLAVRYLRRNPHWLLGGLLVLVVARPTRVFRWLEIGLIGWQAGRRVSQRRGLVATARAHRES